MRPGLRPLPEDPPIPGAVPLEYQKLGINPSLYFHLYFAENNRRAAWNLLQAIEGIAHLCGYDSDSTLRYAFKAKTGLSMREWRIKNGITRH